MLIMENNSSTTNWWLDLVQCPWCGEIPFTDATPKYENCNSCNKHFEIKNNSLEWKTDGKATQRYDAPKGILDIIKRLLDPLSNPLLPMRYWTQFRVEQYYKRVLNDITLAKKWSDHYLSKLNLPKDATILDHGCGRGRHVALLNQLGFRSVGQDMSKNTWWQKLTKNGFQVTPPNSTHLPWKSSSFDLVNDVQVIHYLLPEALENFIKEVKRVLKPGGHWILLDANDNSYGGRHFQHERLLPLHVVRSLVTQNGFKEVDQSYEGFYASVFPYVINFLRKQCGPWPMDVSDYDSWIAQNIQPKKRGLWLLRLINEK